MRLDKKAVKAICAGLELKNVEKMDASKKDIDEARTGGPLPRPSFLLFSGCSACAGFLRARIARKCLAQLSSTAGDGSALVAAPNAA